MFKGSLCQSRACFDNGDGHLVPLHYTQQEKIFSKLPSIYSTYTVSSRFEEQPLYRRNTSPNVRLHHRNPKTFGHFFWEGRK